MKFIFTVDTEWDRWPQKDGKVTIKNISRLPELHGLCLKENIRPTYFCTYEVAVSKDFLPFGESIIRNNEGEIGTHLHPWSNPPYLYDLNLVRRRCPFPNEYPLDVFEAKLVNLKREVTSRFGEQRSYRAGRLGFIPDHVDILSRHGYIVDSSISPYISWANVAGMGGNAGPDFSSYDAYPFLWQMEEASISSLLEVPISIFLPYPILYRIAVKVGARRIAGRLGIAPCWLRPLPGRLDRLVASAKIGIRQGYPVLCMIIHSNELHPECNPYFSTEEKVEALLDSLRIFCQFFREQEISCVTMSEFGQEYLKYGNPKFSRGIFTNTG